MRTYEKNAALLFAALAALLLLPSPAAGSVTAGSIQTHLQEIRGSSLQPERSVRLGPLALDLGGGAILRVKEGVLIPTTPVGGEVREMVFIGEARLTLVPDDDVEAGQLELFTDSRELDETIREMVLVIGSAQVSRAMLGREMVVLGAEEVRRAQALLSTWQASGQRRHLGVEAALLRTALGDPVYQQFVVASLQGEELGEFLFLVEPDVEEQVSLGQFVPLELTEKEKRKALREISKQQRQGRLVGVEVEDLGQWDSWVSSSLRTKDGAVIPGTSLFDARHYVLDVSLDGRKLDLTGRARIQLEALTSVGTVVRLEMSQDLLISAVRASDGTPLPYYQAGRETLVFLPEAPAAGSELAIEVDYAGKFIDKLQSGIFLLRDPIQWHPHSGDLDRATYDVTFEWPDRLELIAGGQRVDGGERSGGRRWERRTQTLPSFGLTFEVGKFRTVRKHVGHVEVEVAMDRLIHQYDREIGDRLLASVADSLEYFESIFGPYPLDEIRVVTTHRQYSQATLGFLTLSNLMMLESNRFTRYRELWLDRREEVFARFFNEKRHPKQVLFYQALDAAGAGQTREAAELSRQALAAEVATGPSIGRSEDEADRTLEAQRLDGRIQALLTRLALDAGDHREARQAFERAEELLGPRKKTIFRGYLDQLEGRLLLHEGNANEAYRLLRRGVLKKEHLDSTEAWLLLAIAAQETGQDKDVRQAIQKAVAVGADVSLLQR